MKRILILLIASTCLFVYAMGQTTALKQIKVKGNSFVIDDDKPFIFRGLNTSDPDRLQNIGHWNKAYFEEIKNWGANVVRFPIHPRAWRKQGKMNYLKMLDEGVQWATELGIYVIMDWHSIGNITLFNQYFAIFKLNFCIIHIHARRQRLV